MAGLIAARAAPAATRGAWRWVRRNLFDNPFSAVATLAAAALLWSWLPTAMDWLLWRAVFSPDLDACQAVRGQGACWGVVAEKYRLILFGRYPFDEQWRPLLATTALLGLLAGSAIRRFWSRRLVLAWVLVLGGFFVLMRGGVAGLPAVPTDRWGGLPLTLMLTTVCLLGAFPIGVLVALGRRSRMPAIRSLCIVYVELVRGVPLVSVLFMASFMFPLFMPPGTNIDVLLRVVAGITLFAAAYMAEIVRGGLQAVGRGQIEAADALGLGYWQAQRKIVLPQALATVVPSVMNSFIGLFKDTSLVTIVGLYELTGAMSLALNSDAAWRPFVVEAYLFIAAIYFAFCFAMSRYSLWVEARLRRSQAR